MFRILYIVLITTGFALSANAQTTREYFGVSFTVPAGWQVEEHEVSPNDMSVACSKTGSEDNTAVTMLFTNSKDDTKELLTTSMDKYTQIMSGMGATMTWEVKLAAVKVGTFNALRSSFTGSADGSNASGELRTFNACGKTVLVVTTEDAADHNANIPVFDAILKSFTCK